jgi:hypothetical protein
MFFDRALRHQMITLDFESFVGMVFHCMMTGAEAAKNVLLDLYDRLAVEAPSSDVVLRNDVSRTNHFIEVVRQPVLVLRQITQALFRTSKFVNFAGNNSTLKRLSTLECFGAILVCREHEDSLSDTNRVVARSIAPLGLLVGY